MVGVMDLDSVEEWRGNYTSEEEEEEKQHFHVLAVDDSVTDRKFLERLLIVSSYQVTCVDSGDKALQYLGLLDINNNEDHNHQFGISGSQSSSSTESSLHHEVSSKVNLIMTDYSMPGMNGYDLLKRIKESSWKDIPVVVMSSENVPSRISMCMEGGAEEFLLKPVRESDLRKLHSHLLMMNTIRHCCANTDENTNTNTKKEDIDNNNNNNNNMANKRKATLTTSSSDRSRPRVVQELPVS